MTDIKDIVALSATILFVIQMLTPIDTFRRIVKLKSTEDMSAAPYNTAFLSCAAWMIYGMAIQDNYVTLTNVYGAALQMCYVICFLLYTSNKSSVAKQLLLSVACIGIALYYCWYETNRKILTTQMAIFCTVITFAFFAAPFVNLGHVLRTRNADSLPGTLIFFTFIVSLLWMLYGAMIGDMALKVTNFVGVLLSFIQLLFIFRFSNGSPKKGEPLLP